MKVLILHNQLWTQYKSVIFQGIHDRYAGTSDEILVLQTSISEKSRLNILDFNPSNFKYTYPYKLLNNTSLEDSNSFKTTFLWIKTIISYRPDVINLTGYADLGTIVVLLLAKILRIKTVMTNESILSSNLHKFSVLQYVKSAYKKVLINLTDGFLSYGLKSNDYLYRFGVTKNQIFSFLNAFDRSKFNVNLENVSNLNQMPYVLFVGRLSQEKNLECLLDLGRKFKADSFNCKVKIVGDGDAFDYLSSVVSSENLPIELEGAKKWDELGAIYKSALAFFLPSFNETWGMVANESLEMGVPVICSKACGCADDLVIDNFNGLILGDWEVSGILSNETYLRLKNYLSKIVEEGNNMRVNKRISSIYDEDKLVDEFVNAFKMIRA